MKVGTGTRRGYPNNTNLRDVFMEKNRYFENYFKRKNVRALVMLSGGADSVALLANILAYTDWEVHVHHIEISNFENRNKAENAALAKIRRYLRKHYRDYEYTVSKFEFAIDDRFFSFDLTSSLFMAAQVTKSIWYARKVLMDLVVTGHLNATPERELFEGSAVFNVCFMEFTKKPLWIRPLIQVGKAAKANKIDVYESIPPELLDLSWSCRTPTYEGRKAEACGTCLACKTRNKTMAELAELAVPA